MPLTVSEFSSSYIQTLFLTLKPEHEPPLNEVTYEQKLLMSKLDRVMLGMFL